MAVYTLVPISNIDATRPFMTNGNPQGTEMQSGSVAIRIELTRQHAVLDTLKTIETQMRAIEKCLQTFADSDQRSQRLQRAGGIGLITATALSAPVGEVDRFRPLATSPAHSALRHANIPADVRATWVASPSAATSTCACC